MPGPALTDVPDRYDVVFQLNDGSVYGFLYADSVESNLPFRTHKALYSYSPTFLERQNVSNQYGDNFQDFFLTGSQNDFSLGEMQKYFRANDPDRSRRYWNGKNVDPTTIPGNVTLTTTLASASTSATVIRPTPSPSINNGGYDLYAPDNTNLYGITTAPSITSLGAHGAGNAFACTADNSNIYIAGSTAIRRFHITGGTFNAYSATTNVSQLVYMNNALYGYQFSTDSLLSFDSAGTATTQFQWKNADGTTVNVSASVGMITYGGAIYIVRNVGQSNELWKYDGTGCFILAQFPTDFVFGDLVVVSGILFVSGYIISGPNYQPSVLYYVNGSLGELWKSPTAGAGGRQIALTSFGNGIIFKDPITGNVYQYDIGLGGVHTIQNYLKTNPESAFNLETSNTQSAFLLVYSGTIVSSTGGNYNSSGFVQTSLYDFDNTLNKVFRGLKVDADIPANTSVDLAYRIDGVGGSYTTLQTGITSGTEYFLPANTNGHAISVQVTLNSATGSATPTLKRIYIRAAPTLQQFRKAEYLFDLSGGIRDEVGQASRRTRDGFAYPYDPDTAAKNLRKIATQTVPFTVVDRFTAPTGFTAIADLQQNQEGYDGHAIYEERQGVYIGRINVREV